MDIIRLFIGIQNKDLHITSGLRYYPLLFALAVFLVGLFTYCFRITGWGLEYVPGDLGDSRFIHYLLEHGHQYLCGNVQSFWSPTIMYPTPNALAFSDNMLGSLPLYSLFRVFQCDMQTAYQLWWMSLCSLNFFCCFYVLHQWTRNPYLSACAAFIFAFGLFNQSQMSYLQMNTRFMIPLVFWYTYQLFTRPGYNVWIFLWVGLVLQFYLSIYLGFLLFYSTLLFALILWLVYKPKSIRSVFSSYKRMVYHLLPPVLACLFILLLLWPYYRISSITGLRYYHEVVPSLASFKSYLFAHETSVPWTFLSQHGKTNETPWWLQNIMPGLLPLLAFVASGIYLLYAKIKGIALHPLLWVVFLTALVLFLLFTRTSGGLSLYALVFKLPGMNSMRVLTRYMHVELFLWLLLLVVLLDQLKPKQFVFLFYGLVFMLVLGDNWFDSSKTLRTSKHEIQQRHLQLEKLVKKQLNDKRIFAVTTSAELACFTHLDAMFTSLSLGIPTINGYSSYCETDFGTFFNTGSKEGLLYWMQKRKIEENTVLIINH